MFVPEWMRANAYRILRLSASATSSEVHKAAASMRRAALLGVAGPSEGDVPALGEVPRTEADIRTAVGRLGNPAHRLTDRLFWFHMRRQPQEANPIASPSQAASKEPDGIAVRHDEALGGLFSAMETGLDDAGVAVWVQALRTWNSVITDDDCWALSLAIEEEGAFEPAALPSEVEALREAAVGLAAEPLVVAARDALSCEDIATASRIMRALDELADTGIFWTAIAQRDIASPAAERVRALCLTIYEELKSNIVQSQDAGAANKYPCDAAIKRFRSEVEPALSKVLRLVHPDHELAQQSREEAALCLSCIATNYTWADDFITAENLREEALKLARDTLGAIRIEDGLTQIRESARKQRVFGEPITSLPSLTTFNGFGCMLYGDSDHDPETSSYTTTHYVVALFLPIFPLARYRVISAGGGQYRFLGKLPLSKGDRWHIGTSMTIIAALFLGPMISSNQDSVSSYAPHSTSNYGSEGAPQQRDKVEDASTSPARHDLGEATAPVPGTTAISSNRSQLGELKARIDSGRAKLGLLHIQLKPVIDELTNIKGRIEALSAELKSLDDRQKAGLEIDIDDYNAKVKSHNSLVNKQRALIAANRDEMQTYNDLDEKDSAMVEQYNSLLRSAR